MAGKTFPTGSLNAFGQPPAAKIAAFNWATLVAVVVFCITPNQALVVVQTTDKFEAFNAVLPTLKRTISLYPSSLLGANNPLSHALTKTL